MPAAAESARPTVCPAPPTMSFSPPCSRRVAHRTGRGVHGDEHGSRDVAGHVEGQTVGALRFHPREESAAVQDRNAGGQYALLCAYRNLLLLQRFRPTASACTAIRSGPVPEIELTRTPSNSRPPWVSSSVDQAIEERHGIDLCLVWQTHAAAERKRHIRMFDPLGGIKSGFLGGREYGSGGAHPVRFLGVGVVVFALDVQPVFLAVPKQPIASFGVPDDIFA